MLLGLQVVTGILLALVYTPSASQAWNSLQFLDHNVTLGWFLRAMHGWGSDFMVAIVLIHMAQVFLFGAYKFPRELTWIVGVFLLLLTLGMAFTGQVLRFDQDAYWGLGIGASIVSRVPWIGGPLVDMMLGGPIIAGPTLSRFFALHVFVIPGILLVMVGLHLWMVLRLGINEWPMPGRLVRKSTYEREYHELTKKTGIPFVPDAAWKDAIFAAAIMLAVMACALLFGPFGPTGQPDPTIIQTAPKPDFAFLWIYAVLAYLPPSLETPVLFIAPIVVIGAMLLLPLVAGEGEKHWSRRPVAVLMVAVIAVTLGVFTRLGHVYAVEPDHGCVDERSDSGGISAGPHAAGAARGARPAEQAVPQLPLDWRSGGLARAGARRDCGAHDGGPDHSPGAAGRRQHAGLRQRAQSCGDDRAGALSYDAAGKRPLTGHRCIEAYGSFEPVIARNITQGALALAFTLIACLLRIEPSLPNGRRQLF